MYANLHFLFLMCKQKAVHFSSFRKFIELCVVKTEQRNDTMKGHRKKGSQKENNKIGEQPEQLNS